MPHNRQSVALEFSVRSVAGMPRTSTTTCSALHVRAVSSWRLVGIFAAVAEIWVWCAHGGTQGQQSSEKLGGDWLIYWQAEVL